MAEEQGPVTVRSITSYEDARTPPPPPPLPVPPRQRLPRWAVALIAVAVALALLVVLGLPIWAAVSVFRDSPEIDAGEKGTADTDPDEGATVSPPIAASEETTGEAEEPQEKTDYFLDPGEELVTDAEPDEGLTAALKADYPSWRFVSGRLKRNLWAEGGMRTWAVQLEHVRHPKVMVEVEYVQMLDAEHRPADEWATSERSLRAGTESVGDSLVDRFLRDVPDRPIFISVWELDPMQVAGDGRTFRVSWGKTPYSLPRSYAYELQKQGQWKQLP